MKGVLFRRTLALFILVLLLADIAILGAYSYFGRKTYIELESQGTYTSLKPGESLDWTVRWFLVPFDGESVPSEALLKQVKTQIGI